jgi:hypothetical protein
LSVETDQHGNGRIAFGEPLAAEEQVHRATPPKRVEAARDRPHGVFCDEDGSPARFRRVGVGAIGLWPTHVESCSKDMSNSSGEFSLVAGLGQRGIPFGGPPSSALHPDGGGDSAVLKRVFVLK